MKLCAEENCSKAGAQPEFFIGVWEMGWGGGGNDSEAVYILCIIFKNYVIKIMS
jgi:hypothetical protein